MRNNAPSLCPQHSKPPPHYLLQHTTRDPLTRASDNDLLRLHQRARQPRPRLRHRASLPLLLSDRHTLLPAHLRGPAFLGLRPGVACLDVGVGVHEQHGGVVRGAGVLPAKGFGAGLGDEEVFGTF